MQYALSIVCTDCAKRRPQLTQQLLTVRISICIRYLTQLNSLLLGLFFVHMFARGYKQPKDCSVNQEFFVFRFETGRVLSIQIVVLFGSSVVEIAWQTAHRDSKSTLNLISKKCLLFSRHYCDLVAGSMFTARAIRKAANARERWGDHQTVSGLQPNLQLRQKTLASTELFIRSSRIRFQSQRTDHRKLVKTDFCKEEVTESSGTVFWIEGPYIPFELKCLKERPQRPLITTSRKRYPTCAQCSSRVSKRVLSYASGQCSSSEPLSRRTCLLWRRHVSERTRRGYSSLQANADAFQLSIAHFQPKTLWSCN